MKFYCTLGSVVLLLLSQVTLADNSWMKGKSAVFVIPNNPIDEGNWDIVVHRDIKWETHDILDAHDNFCQIKLDDKLVWINSAFIWSIEDTPGQL